MRWIIKCLPKKYAMTAWFYDLLDYPWERQYKKWRPQLLSNLRGSVLELGSGTGRNFAYYPPTAKVTAVELSIANSALKTPSTASKGGYFGD